MIHGRLVVKGFNQNKGFDFKDFFSRVVRIFSIIFEFGIATNSNPKIELDVKNTSFMVIWKKIFTWNNLRCLDGKQTSTPSRKFQPREGCSAHPLMPISLLACAW